MRKQVVEPKEPHVIKIDSRQTVSGEIHYWAVCRICGESKNLSSIDPTTRDRIMKEMHEEHKDLHKNELIQPASDLDQLPF